MSSPRETIFLVDNGSLRPEATLGLRRLAAELGQRLGRRVEPVSLLHSHKIPPEKLGGVPAEIVSQAAERRAGAGLERLTILPLFFGPSAALTDYLPKVLARLEKAHPRLRCRQLGPLVESREDARAVAGIIADLVREVLDRHRLVYPPVVLVDHGSPQPAVTEVRNQVAAELAALLGEAVSGVRPASMERRDGPEYAFNEPLLEAALRDPTLPPGPVVLAYLFFLPGRHAGPGGDIEGIVSQAKRQKADLRIVLTSLLGETSMLTRLLAEKIPGLPAEQGSEK
ncbi:MAG: cobalamin biosynthesis protein CbiX [Puniceicoccaceae bacterium]|nr:MAG: cobalamin biosynthesis protein CbiX [Puniceicoccaceae bacterium]